MVVSMRRHDAALVVHFDRGFAEAVLHARPLDTGRELRADLLGQLRRDLPAEEAGDLLSFHAQHGLADELFVERPEGRGRTECQISGVFHLHQAPMVRLPEHIGHRATPLRISIQGRGATGRATGGRPVPGRVASRRSERTRYRPWCSRCLSLSVCAPASCGRCSRIAGGTVPRWGHADRSAQIWRPEIEVYRDSPGTRECPLPNDRKAILRSA